MTRVTIYARVSTSDKDQDPMTQLMPLREFIVAKGWSTYGEYVDQSPTNDLAHRTAWRDLLDDAAKRRFDVVLVFKLDRAFRSVKHMHDTLAAWEMVGVGFQSMREQFDTGTAIGRLLLNLLGGSGGVRARTDTGESEGRHGPGPQARQEDRSSEGNGAAWLLSSFWSSFGAP